MRNTSVVNIFSKLYLLLLLIFALTSVHVVFADDEEFETPKLLKNFPDGCYGLNPNDISPILQKPDDSSVGLLYLVDNPDYTEDSILSKYNVVLCDSRKIDDARFMSFDVLFPQSEKSLDNGESYDDFFKKEINVTIKNSINGNFSVRVSPTFVMLFKSKKLSAKENGEKFRLGNISFALKKDSSESIATTSLTIALAQNQKNPKPTFKNLKLYEQCDELPGDVMCFLRAELRASVDEKLSYTFLPVSNRKEKGNLRVTISTGPEPDGFCTDGKSLMII